MSTSAPTPNPPVRVYHYAVKFVCGVQSGTASLLAPGTYYTAINVRNATNVSITYRKRIALAKPKEQPGCLSKWIEKNLDAGIAMEIDYADIKEHLTQDRGTCSSIDASVTFHKGFVDIKCKPAPGEAWQDVPPLDVVAVYTAAASGTRGNVNVVSIHTERVPPRMLTEPWD